MSATFDRTTTGWIMLQQELTKLVWQMSAQMECNWMVMSKKTVNRETKMLTMNTLMRIMIIMDKVKVSAQFVLDRTVL
jgi:hypothetical protein